MPEIALAHALANVKPDESLRAVKTVEDFVEFLISRLETDLQPLARRFLNEEQLGYRPQMSRLGIILPNALTDLIGDPSVPKGRSAPVGPSPEL